jgi:hypothetical protein
LNLAGLIDLLLQDLVTSSSHHQFFVIAYFYGMFSLHSRNRGCWSLSLSLTCTRVIPGIAFQMLLLLLLLPFVLLF